MKNGSIIAVSALLALVLSAGFAAAAEQYPTKPVTLVNPVSVGGSTDVLGRLWANVAEKYLGKPIVVVNKTGGGGWLGNVYVRDSNPDGYNLALIMSSRVTAIEWELVNGRKPPIAFDQFTYIGAMSKSPALVVTPYDRPWKNLKDLLEYARSNPLSSCSGALYAGSHVPLEMVLRAAGIKISGTRHVAYVGGGPCIQALIGGHYDMATQFPTSVISLMQAKKLRILAVLADKRLESIPDVPTCRELGIDAIFWMDQAIGVPLKTPAPIVEKLRTVFKQTVEDPQFIKMVEDLGDKVTPAYGDDVVKEWDDMTKRVRAIFAEVIKENPPQK